MEEKLIFIILFICFLSELVIFLKFDISLIEFFLNWGLDSIQSYKTKDFSMFIAMTEWD